MKLFLFMLKALVVITFGGVVLYDLALGIAAIIGGVMLIKRNKKSKAWNILFVLLIALGVLKIVFSIAVLIIIVIFCYALT